MKIDSYKLADNLVTCGWYGGQIIGVVSLVFLCTVAISCLALNRMDIVSKAWLPLSICMGSGLALTIGTGSIGFPILSILERRRNQKLIPLGN